MENSYKFFANKECRNFPCHPTDDPDNFNCMFCFCPLYPLGDKCGGNFKYIGGICKDCSDCMLPHEPDKYDYIVKKYDEVMEMASDQHDRVTDSYEVWKKRLEEDEEAIDFHYTRSKRNL